MTATVIVLAKAPVAGRVKTRLCPPCTPEEAAALAEAALVDTLAAVAAVPDVRRVLALDGDPGPWLPPGVEVMAQRGNGLDERLANAFDAIRSTALLIGMDTPQVTPPLLESALRTLADSDAVLGPSHDGGWWAIGLHRADPALFLGVPMSTHRTHDEQLRRLRAHGLRSSPLPRLRDVDHVADARAVAAVAPTGRFAARVRQTACLGPRRHLAPALVR